MAEKIIVPAEHAESAFKIDFKAALRAGVPLVTVQTSDPASVLEQVIAITKEKTSNKDLPLLSWDIAAGLKCYNETGKEALAELMKKSGQSSPDKITDPVGSIKLLKRAPTKSIVFIFNGHRLLHARNLIPEAVIGQAIWNLRDDFKADRRMLVLLAPNVMLPPELINDILVLDEPLPTIPELQTRVLQLYEAASLPAPNQLLLNKASEAVKGLSLFAAEQAVAMSLTTNGLDMDRLWHRKRKIIEMAPGLSIWKEKNKYADVVGIDRAKEFLTAIFNGNDRPTVVLFVDELEKQLSGTQGDLSGVTQEMHGQFLSWMVNENIPAFLMYGQPGCTKSYLAKTTGSEFDCPTIILSITGAKGGVVGQSTGQLADALKRVSAIGRPLLMATCNNVDVLSQELRSRFNLGTYFFDLPDSDSRKATWALYIKKFNIEPMKATIPPDKDWTPREISDCCQLAWRTKWTLKQAAGSITPVMTSSPEKIEERRRIASKRFLSADHAGVYDYNDKVYEIAEQQVRDLKNVGNA